MRSRLRRPGPRRLGVRRRVLLAAAAALAALAASPALTVASLAAWRET